MGSHRHRKFSKYTVSPTDRRKKAFSPYLIIPLCALLAFVLAMILGNTLGDIADASQGGGTPSTTEPPANAEKPTLSVPSIDGVFVTARHIKDSTAQNIAAQIPSEASAVSLELFDSTGAPYYASPTASAFGNSCGELTLQYIFDGVGEGIHASVLFPSSALRNTDEAKQSVINAYEIALIEELYEAGADDVILVTELPELTDEFEKVISSYISTLKLSCPELAVGISLSVEFVSDETNASTINTLAKNFDILALDLTKCDTPEALSETVSTLSLPILRREMRLLLRASNEKELLGLTEILDKNGMKNRQVIAN